MQLNIYFLTNKMSVWDSVKKYPDKNWDWNYLSRKKPSIEFVKQFKDKPWNWKIITIITSLQDIDENDLPWDMDIICSTKILSKKFVEKHKVDWNVIVKNINISLEFVEEFIDKDWNWDVLSSHPNLTDEFVLKYNKKPWDVTKLVLNPNIGDIIDKL